MVSAGENCTRESNWLGSAQLRVKPFQNMPIIHWAVPVNGQ